MHARGTVEIMASTGFLARYVLRNFTDGLIQNMRASGMKKLPRIKTEIFWAREAFFFSLINPEYNLSFFLRPRNVL
jgi:hypothetical protein